MPATPDQLDNALTFLYNACHPQLPATEEQYIDLSKVRGSGAFTKHYCRQLGKCGSGHYECHLFTGHLGSGKSSELCQLERRLEEGTRGKQYLPIYMNADDYLDRNDADIFDILFAVVAEVGAKFRKVQIELQDSYFKARLDELKTIFWSEVEPQEAE